jgi:hypothetical protein
MVMSIEDMLNSQRNDCPIEKKLSEKDLKRIFLKTGGIIGDDCIIWQGYITHNKIDYVNFYFNGKKCALHRLLYINFKGKLNDNDYLYFNCNNKGKCCNINHFSKKRSSINSQNKSVGNNSDEDIIIYFD